MWMENLIGMELQPELRVLCLSENDLEVLEGLPRHPKLEEIIISGNPVCSRMNIRTALIATCAPSLLYIDRTAISAEERRSAEWVTAKMAMCLREGLLLREDPAFDHQLDEFLLDFQRKTTAESVLHVVYSGITGEMKEGNLLELMVVLKRGPEKSSFVFLPRHMVALSISSKDCSPTTQRAVVRFSRPFVAEAELKRAGDDTKTVYADLFYFTRGTYSYQVIVDDREDEQQELTVSDDMIAKATADVPRLPGSMGSDSGTFEFQWLRSNNERDFVSIDGANSPSFGITMDDVGHCLMANCTPIMPSYGLAMASAFSISSSVMEAEPTCVSLKLTGLPACEGSELSPCYRYFGGVEGASEFQWSAEDGTVVGTAKSYIPRLQDVGHVLSLTIFPKSRSGQKGSAYSVPTEGVQAGKPQIRNLSVKIDGSDKYSESEVLKASGEYFGGIEMESTFAWYRNGETIEGATAQSYRLVLADVGCSLEFSYTPKSNTQETGDTVRVRVLEGAMVGPGEPRVSDLNIVGTAMEGEVLQVNKKYFGGVEGPSVVRWLKRRASTDPWEVVGEGTSQAFALALDQVGFLMGAEVIPVREDGFRGQGQTVENSEVVQPSAPRIVEFALSPSTSAVQGEALLLAYKYVGGIEGKSTIRWYHESAIASSDFVSIDGNDDSLSYCPEYNDIGLRLRVTVVPMRSDSVCGKMEAAVSEVVAAGVPVAVDVEFEETSGFEEGGRARVEYVYWGGDEGSTTFAWKRVHDGVEEDIKSGDASTASHVVSQDDVQASLLCEVTPVRKDGTAGKPVRSPISSIVSGLSPLLLSLELPADATEGVAISPKYRYYGGVEGASKFEWKRLSSGSESGGEVVVSTLRDYVPVQADVGQVLRLTVIPVREDGLEGKQPKTCVLASPVKAAEPRATNLRIDGLAEGKPLSFHYDYFGGFEGQSVAEFCRVQSSDRSRKMPLPQFTKESLLSVDDVMQCIGVTVTPIRSDGVRGEAVSAVSEPVEAAPPVGSNVQIEVPVSGLIEGCRLKGLWSYAGGYEGASSGHWYRMSGGVRTSVSEDGCPEYVAQIADVGFEILFEYTPRRSDGVAGSPVAARSPVVQALPPSGEIVLRGGPFISSALEVESTYAGGKEGMSEIVWLTKSPQDGAFVAVAGLKNKRSHIPSVLSLQSEFKVQYTPVRSDGARGAMKESRAVLLRMDPDMREALRGVVNKGEASFAVENDETKTSAVVVFGLKDIRVGSDSKGLFKVSYDSVKDFSLSEDAAFVIADEKKRIMCRCKTKKDRDTVIIIGSLFLSLCAKKNCSALLGSQPKDWTAKDPAKRAAFLASIEASSLALAASGSGASSSGASSSSFAPNDLTRIVLKGMSISGADEAALLRLKQQQEEERKRARAQTPSSSAAATVQKPSEESRLSVEAKKRKFDPVLKIAATP